MKIKIAFDLDDFLEEVEVTDDEDNYIDTYYNVKNTNELVKEIKQAVIDKISSSIRYDLKYGVGALKQIKDEIINTYKDEIIKGVIDKTSKSIMNNKLIKDFKKQIDA